MRQVNLLPVEVQRAGRIRLIRDTLVTTVSSTLLVVLLIHLVLAARVDRLEQRAYQHTAIGETRAIGQLVQKTAGLQREMQRVVNEDPAMMEIVALRFPYPTMLAQLGDLTAQKVWLRGLSLQSEPGTCHLDGGTFTTRLASAFLLELKQSPYCESVELISMEKGDTPGDAEVRFSILCNLR